MNLEQFGIKVTTGKGGSSYYGNTFNESDGRITNKDTDKKLDLTDAEDQSESEYINPSGKFNSRIIRDQNSMIRGIIFTQQ
ncbi:hypothetical protein D3C75_1309970 [compost metagenome]